MYLNMLQLIICLYKVLASKNAQSVTTNTLQNILESSIVFEYMHILHFSSFILCVYLREKHNREENQRIVQQNTISKKTNKEKRNINITKYIKIYLYIGPSI